MLLLYYLCNNLQEHVNSLMVCDGYYMRIQHQEWEGHVTFLVTHVILTFNTDYLNIASCCDSSQYFTWVLANQVNR